MEYDLLIMSLVIFIPSAFALVLLFIPKGQDEFMRWWSLLGTTVTLMLSIWMFIDYQNQIVERYQHSDNPKAALLPERAEKDAQRRPGTGFEGGRNSDWVARYPWIPRFNIEYFLGLDGISMPLVLLTTLLCFLGMIASWKIDRYTRGYCALFLLLETGMLGTFLALDFFLFYIFWEVMLLPMYFLIGVWGGPRREYAAIKFFLYTLMGSVLILIAMLGFYFTDVRDFVPEQVRQERIEKLRQEGVSNPEQQAVVNSFDLITLQRAGAAAADVIDGKKAKVIESLGGGDKAREEAVADRLKQSFFSNPAFQVTMFLLLFIGFAIKVPMFPFHTWLPDAHVEAPTPISMILAGVLLKMGGYGILRIAYPICPWAAHYLAWYIGLFAMINIVYGALAAMAQTDFKKLVAYSSISHMGYVVLGIAVWSASDRQQYWQWAMNGAMFQMIAHGITSAGMFFLVGVIYDRAHHRNLNNFRGLLEPMPLYGGISVIIFFGAMGLPGLCGFVGEFWVVLGTWNFSPVFSILAALTVVLTAAYILWTIQRVFLGHNPAYKDYPDINLRELLVIVPLVVLAVLLGVAPNLLMSWMGPSVNGLVSSLAQLGGK